MKQNQVKQHSDWCARWVTQSVALENRPMLSRLYDATIECSCGTEPQHEQENEKERVLKQRRALMPDYDQALKDWLS